METDGDLDFLVPYGRAVVWRRTVPGSRCRRTAILRSRVNMETDGDLECLVPHETGDDLEIPVLDGDGR